MNKTNFVNVFISYLIIFFPILIILGPLFLNFFSLFFSVYAILNYKIILQTIQRKNKIFLSILLISIFIFPYNNYEFNKNLDDSIIKYFSYLRYLFMSIGLIIYLKLNENTNFFLSKVKKYYLFFLVIISLDIILEFFSGSNIFGFFTLYPGRIASFTGDELIIGYVFAFITLFSINNNILRCKKAYLILLFFLIFILSFIIGERSNFIKLTTVIFIFSLFHFLVVNKLNFKKSFQFFTLLLLFIISFTFVMKNTSQAKKFYNSYNLIKIFKNENLQLEKLFYENKHFAHYDAAIKIFLNNPLFGIGINNFREESKKTKYKSEKFKFTNDRSSNHPHQVYFEILAEVGLVGFIYLIGFNFLVLVKAIKIYWKNKNLDILGHIMLHVFFIYPILPSGSFFGTNYGLPYWFNFSILIFFVFFKKNKI